MVVLNMSDTVARELLVIVDAVAERTLQRIPTLTGTERAAAVRRLQALGVVKHRLHHGLGLEPFRGPIDWGHPLQRRL